MVFSEEKLHHKLTIFETARVFVDQKNFAKFTKSKQSTQAKCSSDNISTSSLGGLSHLAQGKGMEHLDVIIVGAGISGISAAVHLGRPAQTEVSAFSRVEKILVALGICLSTRAFVQTAICIHWDFPSSRGGRKSPLPTAQRLSLIHI